MDAKNEIINDCPEGFVKIRNGILDHIRQGKLSPTELGIYLYLHLTAGWKTGICRTNAPAIFTQFNANMPSVATAKRALANLRCLGYINYPVGSGRRGLFPVLIHKYRPSAGDLVGTELDAFAENGLEEHVYVPLAGDGTSQMTSQSPGEKTSESPLFYTVTKTGTYTVTKNDKKTINQLSDFSDGVIEQDSLPSAFQEESLDSPLVMEKGSGRKPPSSARPPAQIKSFDVEEL
jgi:hypothetical protein